MVALDVDLQEAVAVAQGQAVKTVTQEELIMAATVVAALIISVQLEAVVAVVLVG